MGLIQPTHEIRPTYWAYLARNTKVRPHFMGAVQLKDENKPTHWAYMDRISKSHPVNSLK